MELSFIHAFKEVCLQRHYGCKAGRWCFFREGFIYSLSLFREAEALASAYGFVSVSSWHAAALASRRRSKTRVDSSSGCSRMPARLEWRLGADAPRRYARRACAKTAGRACAAGWPGGVKWRDGVGWLGGVR